MLLKSPTIFEALIEMCAWKCGSVFSNVNLLKATSLMTKVKENTQTSLQQTIKTSPGKLVLLAVIWKAIQPTGISRGGEKHLRGSLNRRKLSCSSRWQVDDLYVHVDSGDIRADPRITNQHFFGRDVDNQKIAHWLQVLHFCLSFSTRVDVATDVHFPLSWNMFSSENLTNSLERCLFTMELYFFPLLSTWWHILSAEKGFL